MFGFLEDIKANFLARYPGVKASLKAKLPESLQANDMVDTALAVGTVIIVAAIVIGDVAAPIYFNTSTTNWDSTSKTVWGVLFVLAVVALLFIFIGLMRHNRQ